MKFATSKRPREIQPTSYDYDADGDTAVDEKDDNFHDDISPDNSLLGDDVIPSLSSSPVSTPVRIPVRLFPDKAAWPPCRCPQMQNTCRELSLDDVWENRLDVHLLSPKNCRVERRPKTRRRWALWLGGAVMFVAGIAGGFYLAGYTTITPLEAATDADTDSSWSTKRHDAPVLVYSSSVDHQAGVIASIRSVQMHASGPVEFLYIGDDPLPGIEEMPQVRYRQLSQIVEKYKLKEFTNPTYARSGKNSELNTEPANYVRFVLHELFPKQDKVMWIDADTIVECDVVQLFNNTFADSNKRVSEEDALKTLPAIAAVPRDGFPIGLSGRGRNIYSKLHGKEEHSFNAGIYLLELNRWRAQKLTEKVRGIAQINEQENLYYTGSQPPLALAVGGKFEHLPTSWNVKMRYAKVVDGALREKICLMHWSGPNKPWERGHEDKIHSNFWRTYGNPAYDEAADKKELSRSTRSRNSKK